ncbi:MAG TPA: aminoacetone oxidase family FAD-binding enzyme [Bacilli bacterium]|nr:aminoacetone oxidase family FAD-binding enzyme [Bacilli bacterium]
MKVAYIGAGPMALFSAHYLLNDNADIQVHIYEKTAKIGRKIYSSGNGRGNISNMNVGPQKYNHPDFVSGALRFTPADFINYLQQNGILTMTDDEGRVYPYGEAAAIIGDWLRDDLLAKKVIFHLDTEVISVNPYKSGYQINNDEYFDVVVFATGSRAGIPLNQVSRGMAEILRALKLKTVELIPTLASIGIKSNLNPIDGRRLKANVSLFVDQKLAFGTKGEVLFRTNALSGIAIFECSSILTWIRRDKISNAYIELDLLPDLDIDELTSFISQAKKRAGTEYLRGLFHPDVAHFLTRHIVLKPASKDIAYQLKHWQLMVDLGYVAENNQVFSGGLAIDEIDANTLQLKRFPHLYAGGEMVDVDGLCGGYNLHWAWASGVLIAKSIGSL